MDDHHHHKFLHVTKYNQNEDKTKIFVLNFRDITVGASDDSANITHLGMKHRTK